MVADTIARHWRPGERIAIRSDGRIIVARYAGVSLHGHVLYWPEPGPAGPRVVRLAPVGEVDLSWRADVAEEAAERAALMGGEDAPARAEVEAKNFYLRQCAAEEEVLVGDMAEES